MPTPAKVFLLGQQNLWVNSSERGQGGRSWYCHILFTAITASPSQRGRTIASSIPRRLSRKGAGSESCLAGFIGAGGLPGHRNREHEANATDPQRPLARPRK